MHFVSNDKQYVRLFERRIPEEMTHGFLPLPLLIYTPIIAWQLWYSWQQLGGLSTLIYTTFGVLFLWSLSEYILHRWAFHFISERPFRSLSLRRPEHVEGSTWAQRLQFQLHGVHHDYPRDRKRPVIPLPFSFAIASLVYGSYTLAFGQLNAPLFAGFLIGYLLYDYIHYLTHQPPTRWKTLNFLRTYHLWHHYKEPEKAYGVTTPFWDWAFGTLPALNWQHYFKAKRPQSRAQIAPKVQF